MTTFARTFAIACLAGSLFSGAALAQNAAPATGGAPAASPSAKSTATKMPSKMERTEISKKCSAEADAKKLHNEARKKFRADCMKKG